MNASPSCQRLHSVCIISGLFHPDVGGPTTYLLALTEELQCRRIQFSVIAFGENGGSYPYPVFRISRHQHPILRLLRFIWKVYWVGRRHDLLYVLDYGLPAALANLVLRKPMLMKVVEDFAWEYSVRHGLVQETIEEFQTRRHSWRVEMLKRIRSFYIGQAHRVIVPSHYLSSLVERMIPSPPPITVIHNSVLFAALQPRVRPAVMCCGPRVVTTVARLALWKGVDGVIRALAGLPDEVTLHVVGDGAEREPLEALARSLGLSSRVRFLGVVPPGDVPKHLAKSDLFVLNSTYEGFPHVVIEAMAAGVPVVATRVGGTPEIITHEKDGLLVDAGDIKGLQEAIRRGLFEPGLGSRLMANAAITLKQFAPETMFEETIACFDRLVEAKRACAG